MAFDLKKLFADMLTANQPPAQGDNDPIGLPVGTGSGGVITSTDAMNFVDAPIAPPVSEITASAINPSLDTIGSNGQGQGSGRPGSMFPEIAPPHIASNVSYGQGQGDGRQATGADTWQFPAVGEPAPPPAAYTPLQTEEAKLTSMLQAPAKKQNPWLQALNFALQGIEKFTAPNNKPVEWLGNRKKQYAIDQQMRVVGPMREQTKIEQESAYKTKQMENIDIDNQSNKDRIKQDAEEFAFRKEAAKNAADIRAAKDAKTQTDATRKSELGHKRYIEGRQGKRNQITANIAEMTSEIPKAQARLAKHENDLRSAMKNPKANKATIGRLNTAINAERKTIADKEGNVDRHRKNLDALKVDLTREDWGIVGDDVPEQGQTAAQLTPEQGAAVLESIKKMPLDQQEQARVEFYKKNPHLKP